MDNPQYSPYDHLVNQIGMMFQKFTKYKGDSTQHISGKAKQPDEEITLLPTLEPDGNNTLFNSIRYRRSIRKYDTRPISSGTLGKLLWSIQGVTAHRGDHFLRATPSAGALYPIETWIALLNVSGLAQGIARYVEQQHGLQWLRKGDFRQPLYEACMNQDMILHAPILFIWVADLNRCVWRYSQRAYRYIYLDAGHMAQNCALAATALGLGSCAIAAFFDDYMDYILERNGQDQTVIYLTSVGYAQP